MNAALAGIKKWFFKLRFISQSENEFKPLILMWQFSAQQILYTTIVFKNFSIVSV
jgi:hypothetical protein